MALPVLLTSTGETIDVEQVTNDIADTIVKRIEGIELNVRTMSQVDVVVEPIQLIAPEGDGDGPSGDASKVHIEEQPDAVRLLMSIDKYLYSMHFDALALRGLKDEVIEIKDQLRMQEEIAESKDADKLEQDADAEDDNGGIKELVENIEMHTAQTAAHAEKILDKMATADPEESTRDNTGDAGTDPNEAAPEKKQGVMGKMFGGIMKSIKKLFKGISLFILGLSVLAMALISGGGPLMQQVKDLFDTFMNDVLPPLLEGIMKIVDQVMPVVLEIFQTVGVAFGKIVEMVMPAINKIIEQLLPPLMELFNNVVSLFMSLVELVMPIINDLIENLLPPLIDLFNVLMDVFMEMVEFLMPVLQEVAKYVGVVVGVLGTVVSAIVDVVGAALAFVQGDTSKAKNMLLNAGDKVMLGIANLINGVIDFVANLVGFLSEDKANKVRSMRVEFGDKAQARIDQRNEESGATADKMEGQIDFDADRATVKAAIEDKVAKGDMSETVGEQLLQRYDEKQLEEQKDGSATLVTEAPEETSPVADPETAELMAKETQATARASQDLIATTPTTPAAGINDATAQEKESSSDARMGSGGNVKTDINTQQINNTTAISSSTTGIISSGGGSSLSNRSKRVLPGQFA
jgi:hypothetical protein